MMTKPVSDLGTLLRMMEPMLHEGTYVYSMVPPDHDARDVPAIATFREAEGLTLIVAEADAVRARLPVLLRAAWITLRVQSDLLATGLTAAFSRALAEAGIPCNVVAAACHDHLFVPFDRAQEAMDCLHALQAQAAQ